MDPHVRMAPREHAAAAVVKNVLGPRRVIISGEGLAAYDLLAGQIRDAGAASADRANSAVAEPAIKIAAVRAAGARWPHD
ncbi:hypothetical protein [Streptomyces longisporoflavus]|uniref:Uncharacterized protein n=1 Tax=Streptomyces longisporoflavus TaxID=28044 RepID=A0ABW7QPT1_9ACTN